MSLVWESTLDGVWKCEVVRGAEPYTGTLTVFKEGDPPILTRPVTLSYNAQFGPDVGDVQDWADMAIEAVDGQGS